VVAFLLGVAGAFAAGRSRIAVVVSDDLEAYRAPAEAFLAQLAEQPRVYNLRGRPSEAARVVKELDRENPAVVVCIGAKAAYAVRNGLSDTPLVYAGILDPRRYGIEGNQVTGVTMDVEPVTFLSQFTGFFPEVDVVGVIRGPDTTDARIDAMTAAASELGRRVVVHDVTSSREVRGAFVALVKQGVDAMWVPPDRTVLTTSGYRTITEEARRRHLPLLVDTENMVEAGGLFTIVPSADGIGRQAAELVQKVLDGASPAVLPPEDPEELLVVLNTRTLEAAELPFDRLLLDFVDVVIE